MPDGREAISVEVTSRIAELPAAEWDACAGPDNPFVGHAFLAALEESGSVTAESGWLPQHLARQGSRRLLTCLAEPIDPALRRSSRPREAQTVVATV